MLCYVIMFQDFKILSKICWFSPYFLYLLFHRHTTCLKQVCSNKTRTDCVHPIKYKYVHGHQ